MEEIKEEKDINIIKPRKGPKPKYTTDEERHEARREHIKQYYERNKEEIKRKQVERYAKNKDKINAEQKKAYDIYKKYKQGKVVEI
jgi:hypothetical protein